MMVPPRRPRNEVSKFIGDPRDLHPNYDGPKGKHGIKYRWRKVSDEQDLPFVEETKRILSSAHSQVQVDKSQNVKKIIKQDLEKLGWMHKNRATLKANLFLRRKYVVFESTTKLDAEDVYRLKVTIGRNRVLDYKLMRRVLKL